MKRRLLLTILLAVLTLPGFTGNIYAQEDQVKVVVIDAGHGGHDPGNLGTRRYSTREKDIALAVSLKVGNYIEQNLPDVKVVYTRKTDVFVELQERAAIANRAGADLFISIHCDAFTESSVHGATSLVMGRNHDDDNLRVAMRENSVILLEENYEEKYQGFDPNNPASYIAFTITQSAFIHQSVSFAQKVQDQFRERVSRRDRGVKQQPLMVTKMAVMPAVLVELGFLTNPAEEDFLNTENGQAYMASAIYRAFKEYKQERESLKIDRKPVAIPVEAPDKPSIEGTPETPEDRELSGKTETQPTTGAYYSVQIVTSLNKKELSPENFKGVEGVEFYQDGGVYKYIVGRTDNVKAADALKQKMRQTGFRDAFVVALADGKRITLAEARKLLE